MKADWRLWALSALGALLIALSMAYAGGITHQLENVDTRLRAEEQTSSAARERMQQAEKTLEAIEKKIDWLVKRELEHGTRH